MTDWIIQYATNDSVYEGMCDDHEARHRAYAEKWGLQFYRVGSNVPDSWIKLERAKSQMMDPSTGVVILLDADAFITDFSIDLREALPSWAWLGLVKHPYPAYGQATHWNVGMSYWRACPEAIKFLDDLFIMRAEEGVPEEQYAINALLWGGRQEGFCDIPRQFNNNWHDMDHEGAVVMGFHGFFEPEMRRWLMKKVAEKYPYG